MKKLNGFRFWCQKVLPLVYEDSISYYEVLCKLSEYLNTVITELQSMGEKVESLNNAFTELKTYIDNYFTNLDLQEEVNNKLDQMYQDGQLGNYSEAVLNKGVRHFDIYSAWNEINVDYTTGTIIDVFNHMPDYSIFITDLDETSAGFMNSPTRYGTLTVIKLTNLRTRAVVSSHQSADVWECIYYNNGTDPYYFSTWYNITRGSAYQSENDPLSTAQIIEVAESYLNREFIYGNQPTASDDLSVSGPTTWKAEYNGNYYDAIDCLTFIKLVLSGIDYRHSKYVNSANPWRLANYYPWSVNPDGKFLYDFSQWVYYSGFQITPGVDYSNLRAGDLIFWGGNHNKTSFQNEYWKYFKNIDHVAMFTGRWVPDPNRDNTLHPETIEVQYSATPSNNVVTHRFIDEESSDDALTSHSVQYIQMYARIPLMSKGNVNSESNLNILNKIFSYSPLNGVFYGDGNSLSITIAGQNMIDPSDVEVGTLTNENGTETENQARLRTGFIPYNAGKLAYLDIISGLTLVGSWYYDSRMNFISTEASSAPNAAYIRRVYRKNDSSNFTRSDVTNYTQSAYINANVNYGVWTPGYCANVFIPVGVLQKGERLFKINDLWAVTSGDGWKYIDSSISQLLNNIFVHDSYNNIFVPTGQRYLIFNK